MREDVQVASVELIDSINGPIAVGLGMVAGDPLNLQCLGSDDAYGTI